MYTAVRVDNSFHVAINGHGRMRSNSKIGIIRLIMTNIFAWRDLADKGFVTITTWANGRYIELQIAREHGQLVLINTFSAKED